LAVLQRVGCEGIQGYLVGRPMPVSELAALVQGWDALPRPVSGETLPNSVQGPLEAALPLETLE
jgi:hypothetical protein